MADQHVIDEYAPFNKEQIHTRIDERNIALSPSTNREILYATVKIPEPDNGLNCASSWNDTKKRRMLNDIAGTEPESPREYERALAVWYARIIGARTVIISVTKTLISL